MSTVVTIHVTPKLDAALRSGREEAVRSAKTFREFHELLDAYGTRPQPLFAGNRAPVAETIWHAAVPEKRAAEIVEKLLRTPGVTGAYVKPADALPGPP